MQSKLKAGNVRFSAAMVMVRLFIGKQSFESLFALAREIDDEIFHFQILLP
jgi:hypothetical protein